MIYPADLMTAASYLLCLGEKQQEQCSLCTQPLPKLEDREVKQNETPMIQGERFSDLINAVVCPERGNRAGKVSRAKSYEEQLRELGMLSLEKESQRGPYCSPELPEGRV